MAFCKECGAEINDKAVICPNCGCATGNPMVANVDPNASERNPLVVLLLAIFGGYLGLQSFYTGKIGIGIAQLVTLGGCGIWTIIDIITIITGTFRDVDGKTVKL